MSTETVTDGDTGRRDFYDFCYGKRQAPTENEIAAVNQRLYGESPKEGADKHVEAPAPTQSEKRSASMMSIYGIKM